MIIFGWGRQTIKNFGPVLKLMCGRCNHENLFLLIRTMAWFTLFFIPIFPYKISYRLICPICEYGFELEEKQIDEIKPLAEINQLLIAGKISETEYNNKRLLLEKVNDTTDGQKINNTIHRYCEKCGGKVRNNTKFCANCGNKN